MDIKTLLHNLREEVSCPVCTNIYTDPKHLPCLHSFCLQCLSHWHRSSHGRDTIRCQKCQAVSRVPDSGDLKDLPTSFYLNGLIDVLAIKECKTSQVGCGNCQKKSSESSYCFQCCMFWCEECLIAHNIIQVNKDHRVLALKDFQEKDYEDVLKRPLFCSKQRHEKEELKYFCKNCETAACQSCVLIHHTGHAMLHLEEEAERQKMELKSLIEIQKNDLQAKINTLGRLNEDCAKLIQQSEDIKKQVQTFVDNLIATIKAKKQNIILAADEETKRFLGTLTTQKTEIESEIKIIESSLEKADTILKRSTHAEVVQLKKSFEEIFKGTNQSQPKDRYPEKRPVLAFVENPKMLSTINAEEIGMLRKAHQTKASQSLAEGKGLEEAIANHETHFSLTTRDSKGRQCYNEGDHVTVEIIDEQGRNCAEKLQIIDNKDGLYKISYSARKEGRCKATIKVNGELVHGSQFIVRVKPFQPSQPKDRYPEKRPVLAFVENPKMLSTINAEEIGMLRKAHQTKASQSLAEGKGLEEAIANHETHFSLTTRDSKGRQCYNEGDHVTVEIIDEQGRNCAEKLQIIDNKDGLYKISYSARKEGRCKATIKVNGELVHGSQFIVRVKPFQLRPVLSFGEWGSSVGKFNWPWGVAVNANDEIAVTDQNNHRVQIFNSEGKFLRSFGKKGDMAGEFNNPLGITFHNNGNIFVADSSNHRIQIFSGEGEFVGRFGGAGSLDSQLSNPMGLSVDSEGNIIVTDAGNKLIKIFSPDGKFLTKIGEKGFFNFPWHCIQYDRYLIVSDYSDNFIKVFDRNGKFQYKFGKKGAGDGDFSYPECLSVNKSGQVMVCDSGNCRIQVFELNGKFFGKFGTEGKNFGEFISPSAIAVLSTGRFVVTNSCNHRIQIIE